MKRRTVLMSLLLIVLLAAFAGAQSLKGMSLNGSTGIVSIPSGRIGWERTAEFGLDLGYHAVIDEGEAVHIPKISASLFRVIEAAFAYDSGEDQDNSDMIISGKFQLPIQRASSIAIGGNAQLLQVNDESENVIQIYLAATYPGDFFKMPAQTTFVVGKSFGDPVPDEDIDFGMGFDLLLFPEVLQGYVHWINDFANFSYSYNAAGANARNRGVFNTGIRIDLAASPLLSRYKAVIDAIVTDALDDERAFAVGAVFGVPLR